MTYRVTITLDDENYAFIQAQGGKHRSRFINGLLHNAQQAILAANLYQANLEEANDSAYQMALSVWSVTLLDGLN
jgi:hypothetical protein